MESVAPKQYALSSGQRNILNGIRLPDGIVQSTITTTVFIKGRLDAALLERSVECAVRSESTLHTRITFRCGEYRQYIAPTEDERYPFYDFSLSDDDGFARFEEAVARTPLPFNDSPLYSIMLFKRGENSGGVIIHAHHIISDGWSVTLFCNRLAEHYLSLLSGSAAPYPDSPPYIEHVEREEAYYSSSVRKRDTEYWKELLKNYEAPSTIKEYAGANISTVGARRTFALSRSLGRAITDFCQARRISPFAVYYMALATYISRVSSSEGSCIGVPVFNRVDMREKATLGMFVSTLPFIFKLDSEWSFEELNTRLEEAWLDMLRHQRLPYGDIAALSAHEGPLFNIALSYQPSRVFVSPDASVSFTGAWHYSGFQREHLLIHLSSMEGGDRFRVDYDYLTQLYSEDDIASLHERLITILSAALQDPSKPLYALPITSGEDIERVIYSFNDNTARLPYDDAASMLCDACREYALRAAVISRGKRLTYFELYKRATALASHIESLSARDGVIAILLQKTAELPAVIFASLLSGNAFLTLPYDIPDGRLLEILASSRAKLVFTDARALSKRSFGGVTALDASKEYKDVHGTYQRAEASKLAYMVYTSGSTGKPKGVMIGQKALVNLAYAIRPLYGHGAVLSLCSTGFDVFVMECAAALMNGRTVVFPTEEETEDPRALASVIRGYAVGNIALTPSRLAAYMAESEFSESLKGVESIVLGGEHFMTELASRLFELTGARIYNQYGPSETAVAVLAKLMNGAAQLTCGKPLLNCRMYVLDTHMRPLPTGVRGELYIGGLAVGMGYSESALNEGRFIENPFEKGERLFRTGDAASWTADGEIVILGRLDSQIKLRGLRIEPDEIAERIASLEGVGRAAVKLSPSGVLTAFYTADAALDEARLISHLASYLPDYMLPGAYCRVKEIPLGATGKADLSKLDCALAEKHECGLNATASALAIANCFKNALKLEHVSVAGDFFALGGNSLLAMEALIDIERVTRRRFSIRELYALRTPARLAALIDTHGEGGASESAERRDIKEYKATPTQVTIYLDSVKNDSTAYNMPGAIRFTGAIDREKLSRAFASVIESERILRTGFVLTGKGVTARIFEKADFTVGELTSNSFEEASRAFVKSFELSKPPLMRAAWWGDVLFIDMHHIIADGLSTPLIIAALERAYAGEKAAFAPDFAEHALDMESASYPAEAEAYFRRATELAYDPFELPFDTKRELTPPLSGAKTELALEDSDYTAAKEYCKTHGVSEYSLYMAAFFLTVSRLTGKRDLTIGTPVSGRTEARDGSAIGPYIRPLPMRVTLADDMTADALTSLVSDTSAAMLDAQAYPYEQMTAGANYTCLFSMRPFEGRSFRFANGSAEITPIDTVSAKLPLSLEAYAEDGKRCFSLEYAKDMIDRATAEAWLRAYAALLMNMLASPAREISALEAYSKRDALRLFTIPERTRTEAATLPISAFFAEQAALSPESPAIISHGGVTSYGALYERAQKMAASLKGMGIETGDAIGILSARDADMLALLLAVNMAGGAYVPLLTSLPKSRVTSMLESARAKLLIVSDGLEIPECDIRTLTVSELIAMEAGALPDISDIPEDGAAYILFTSGTTGKPKGAVNTHKAVANLLFSMKSVLDGASRVLCSTNCTFDIFMTESLLPLALGKCVVIADEEEMLLPFKLAALMEEHSVELVQFTPSRLSMCLGDASFRKAAAKLSATVLVGEPLTLPLISRYREATNAKLFNMYGPTEACVYVSGCECSRETARVTIGKPLNNCRMYVLDHAHRRSIVGAIGELYLAGACLSSGYIGEKALTDEAFLSDPFYPNERMYKTGDLVRLLPTGEYEFIGRADSQIKLDGQRTEPNEVTEALLALPCVNEAATVPMKYPDGRYYLRSAAALSDKSTTREDIIGALSKKLPSYMLPRELIILSTLPRSSAGKADLRAIAALDIREKQEDAAQAEAQAAAPVAPAAPQEQALDKARSVAADEAHKEAPASLEAALESAWREALSCDTVDMNVSFFEQGGTSLRALDALSRYYNLGLAMSVADFYKHPTLKGQLALLEGAHDASTGADAPGADTQREGSRSRKKAPSNMGGVLVTGATGYLGAHIVRELARAKYEAIYCLVRGGAERLTDTLEFYFGAEFLAEYGSLIRPVPGDISKAKLGISEDILAELSGNVTALIHAAADTRHFAADAEASVSANSEGARNAALTAKALGARLIHISTESVAHSTGRPFDECDLAIDPESTDNVYVRGKALAEAAVRREMASGLDVKIFRMGRLTARREDGRFQKDPGSNAFYSFIKTALTLSRFPLSSADMEVELSPVDDCARAAVLLISGERDTYHIVNPVTVRFSELMATLHSEPFAFVEDAEFEAYLASLLRERPSRELVMLKETWEQVRSGAHAAVDSSITAKELVRMGFIWKRADAERMLKCYL